MCGPAMGMIGSLISTAASVDAANRQDDQDERDALGEKDEAQAHVEKLMRVRRQQLASARAAIAASGTRLDEFSEINTADIERQGARDEQMVLLSGERRSRAALYGQGDAKRAAIMNGIGDLISTGYQSGWKGAQGGG